MTVSFQTHPMLKQSVTFPLASQQQIDKFPDAPHPPSFWVTNFASFLTSGMAFATAAGSPTRDIGARSTNHPQGRRFRATQGTSVYASPSRIVHFVVGSAVILGHAKDFKPSHDAGTSMPERTATSIPAVLASRMPIPSRTWNLFMASP